MSELQNPANKNKIIFLHLSKTGGTTLNGIINQQYARDTIFNMKGINSKDSFKQLSSSEKEKIKIFRGHMAFGLHDFLSYPCTYFTLLREPTERVLSHYYYICNNPDWKDHEIAQAKSLEEYLMKQGEFNDLSNLQIKLLCGTSQVNWANKNQVLETAKNNLYNHFTVVGITERFDETLLILQYSFAWNIPLYVRQNVAKNRLSKPSEQILNTIKQNNRMS